MINIWFDFTCPYCYSGIRKILMAKKRLNKELEINFHSFLLNTEIKEKESFREHLIKAYGFNEEQINEKYISVRKTLDFVGIKSNPLKLNVVATLLAHQILHNLPNNKKLEYIENVMYAHFVQGEDISDFDVIKTILDNLEINNMKIDYEKADDLILEDRILAEKIWFDYIPYVKALKGNVEGDFNLEDLMEII